MYNFLCDGSSSLNLDLCFHMPVFFGSRSFAFVSYFIDIGGKYNLWLFEEVEFGGME